MIIAFSQSLLIDLLVFTLFNLPIFIPFCAEIVTHHFMTLLIAVAFIICCIIFLIFVTFNDIATMSLQFIA